MQPKDNKFIDTIYKDFEHKLYKVFGFGIEDLKKVLNRPEAPEKKGHDLDEQFKEAFEAGGAPQLRREMNNVIACLEYVFMSRKMDGWPIYDEWADHILSLDLGMTKDDLVSFDNKVFEDLP